MNAEALFIRNKVSKFRWAADYVDYMDFRDRGQKSNSAVAMQRFVAAFQRQKPAERRRLILSVYENLAPDTFNDSLIIPFPISKELFADEIRRWMKDEPRNSVAFTWSDRNDDLIEAIRLDPQNFRAVCRYARIVLESVAMAQHELDFGFGYIGDPYADLADMERLTKMFEQLKDPGHAAPFKARLEKYKQINIDYIARNPNEPGVEHK